MQDWLALSQRYYSRPAKDETINDPTNPRHYWRYRMRTHVEELLQDRDLVRMIRSKNSAAGRLCGDERSSQSYRGTSGRGTIAEDS